MSELAALPPPQPRVLDERELARERLAAASRALLDAIVDSQPAADDLGRAADELEALAARLRADTAPRRLPDNPFHPLSLVGGTAHPFAPQVAFKRLEHGVTGTVTLGPVFEGGPTLAHGGVLALIFDHAMGAAVYVAGHVTMTRSLEVTYTAPTPLETELTVRAEVADVTGRQVRVHASLAAGDTVTAEASGIFIRLTQDNLARIFGATS